MPIDIRDHIAALNARAAAQQPRPVPRPPPAPVGPTKLDPVSDHIAAMNRRTAAQQPRPRPAPAPAGLTRLDQAALQRDPATQHVRAFNAKAARDAEAQQAARAAQREREQAGAAIRAEILEQQRADTEHELAIQQAIRLIAEKYLLTKRGR
jgi:hypothetical protein